MAAGWMMYLAQLQLPAGGIRPARNQHGWLRLGAWGRRGRAWSRLLSIYGGPRTEMSGLSLFCYLRLQSRVCWPNESSGSMGPTDRLHCRGGGEAELQQCLD